jgi:hypothetical protein
LSPASQRGEDSVSGRITQARVLDAESVEPAAQPERTNTEAAATAAIEINEDFFISLPSFLL